MRALKPGSIPEFGRWIPELTPEFWEQIQEPIPTVLWGDPRIHPRIWRALIPVFLRGRGCNSASLFSWPWEELTLWERLEFCFQLFFFFFFFGQILWSSELSRAAGSGVRDPRAPAWSCSGVSRGTNPHPKSSSGVGFGVPEHPTFPGMWEKWDKILPSSSCAEIWEFGNLLSFLLCVYIPGFQPGSSQTPEAAASKVRRLPKFGIKELLREQLEPGKTEKIWKTSWDKPKK